MLGLVPVTRVSLQKCLDHLVREAQKSDADGVANLNYHVEAAHVFKFSVFPIPDWSATIWMTGTAYKLAGASMASRPSSPQR